MKLDDPIKNNLAPIDLGNRKRREYVKPTLQCEESWKLATGQIIPGSGGGL